MAQITQLAGIARRVHDLDSLLSCIEHASEESKNVLVLLFPNSYLLCIGAISGPLADTQPNSIRVSKGTL